MRSFWLKSSAIPVLAIAALAFTQGCGGAVIEPGHRALRFDPKQGGLQKEVLQPGYTALHCGPFTSVCPRVDDFDVTYSTRHEEITTNSQEGLPLNLKVAVVYRPIIAELYQLDTEIGPTYYEEVVQPEFKSAARGVFARHSYLDLQKKNKEIEDDVEAELRKRVAGKHIEISSVLLESVDYAPEIAAAIRAKLVNEQEAARNKALMEQEAARRKREMEIAAEQRHMATEAQKAQEIAEAQRQAEVEKLKLENEANQKKLEIQLATEEEQEKLASSLRVKTNERMLAEQDAQIDRIRAEAAAATKITEAHGESEARLQLARASAEEKKAEGNALTPMHVMMHAYDALAHLGGTGTTIMLGDWSHVPNFLFPRVPAFNSAFTVPWSPYTPPMGAQYNPYIPPPMPVAPPPPSGPTSSNDAAPAPSGSVASSQ